MFDLKISKINDSSTTSMSFVVFRASFLLRRSKDVHKLTNVFRGTVLLRSYNISWKSVCSSITFTTSRGNNFLCF